MLNRTDGSGYPCLAPEFSRKDFSFSPLSSNAGCGFVINGFYYVEICSHCIHSGRNFFFIMTGC